MTIDEIRKQMAEIINVIPKDGYAYGNGVADQILNTEIVPERECPSCDGADEDIIKYCPHCNGTGKLPPITVEQAIWEVTNEHTT